MERISETKGREEKPYRENDAKSPQILQQETKRIPLRTLPEISLKPWQIRNILIDIKRYAGIFIVGTVPFNISRPSSSFIYFFFLILGCRRAPPVLAVESAGTGGGFLGLNDMEGAGFVGRREERVAMKKELVRRNCGGDSVENSAAGGTAIGYGQSHLSGRE